MGYYDKLYMQLVHTKLKEKIIGKVFVKVDEDDDMFIQIISYDNLVFKTYIRNFSDKFVNGYAMNCAVSEVIKEYKEFVMNTTTKKYFI